MTSPYLRAARGGVFVIGHRGAMAVAPENTIASFARAEADGVDAVELDVQRTADGVVVVFHDETLERTTNGAGRVRATAFADLRRLDAGASFGPEHAGERVPSLDDVAAWLAPRRLHVSCELKQHGGDAGRDAGLPAATCAVLSAHGLRGRVIVNSFDRASVARVRALDPGVATALILGYRDGDAIDPGAALSDVPGLAGLHVHWPRVTRELCAAAHAEGMHVHAWGMPEPSERDLILKLADLGVDSMSANAPAALVRLLEAEGLRPGPGTQAPRAG